MVKKSLVLLIMSLVLMASLATAEKSSQGGIDKSGSNQNTEENTNKNADELVQSKAQENINYVQLMELLGKGLSLIQEGIIRENQAMVASGTDLIMFHPAPNHKPWSIFAKKDQQDFKKTLLNYDKILHKHADATISFAEEHKWLEANESASALAQSCINCHMVWKSKVVH